MNDHPNTGRLDQLTPLAPRRAGPDYSRAVRFMRLLFPIAALCIVGLLFAWPRMDQIGPQMVEQAKQPKTVSNELINPRFESEDDDQQPFTVTAIRAVQSSNNSEVVVLDHPRASVALSSGADVEAAATTGFYRQTARQLILEGAVEFHQSEGYQMQTSRLLVDMNSRRSWTEEPVSGSGPAGTIEAAGMDIVEGGNRLVFTGPAKLILTRKPGQGL